MGQTSIEWTDYTFNGLWGCEKISPGCKNCYAMTFDKRVGGDHWGPGKPRREFGDDYWAQPLAWEAKAKRDGRIYRVFCSSMADWLEDHPQWIEPRARLETLVAATPNLIWLFLTKRPENWRLMPESWQRTWPLNAMFGFTGENQPWLDARLSQWRNLRPVSRGLRTFISMEPLLSGITFGNGTPFVDWVICGGESGAGARPMHPDWARKLRDDCAAAFVPFLHKQWGEWLPYNQRQTSEASHWRPNARIETIDINGGRNKGEEVGWAVANSALRLMPAAWVGKNKSGRLLDGVEHNGLPLYWPPNVGMIQQPNPLAVLA